MPKKDINNYLDNPPILRQPKGVHLSTDLVPEEATNAPEQESTKAGKYKSTKAQEDLRPSLGYRVRLDIADELKVLSKRQRKKFYMIMEEALLKYLAENGIDLPSLP